MTLDTTPLRSALERGADALELPLGADTSARLIAYLLELVRWNRAFNLTAVRDPRDMVTRHLLDCLAVSPHVSGTLVDVGSGAGLPGIPLAVVRPEQRVVLLDSNGKRYRFLRTVVRNLRLDNVEVAQSRAESWRPRLPDDVTLISRGLARLAAFVEMTHGLGGVHARWLAMKGKLDAVELAELPEEFTIVDSIALHVPGLHEARHLIEVKRRTVNDVGRRT